MNNRLYAAARARAAAEKETAISTLEVYFNKSVGIGEHPDLATEIDKYVDLLATANDRIDALDCYSDTVAEPSIFSS
jgi:hypothetical protein|tara:strand:+ start:330 stop:560 length:231 start_codon:yes stop_codon:yes gene_type:complete